MSAVGANTQQLERSVGLGMWRGLQGHCPNCGKGRLFHGYLDVEPTCEVCGHDLGAYRADDGPAYFTILIVGHLVIAPMLCFSFIWQANTFLVVGLTLPIIAAVTLLLLPRVKGAFMALQWATRTTNFG